MLVGLGQGGMFVVVFHMQSVSLCFRNHFEQKTLLNESAFRIFVAAGQCVFGISSLGRVRGGVCEHAFGGSWTDYLL